LSFPGTKLPVGDYTAVGRMFDLLWMFFNIGGKGNPFLLIFSSPFGFLPI